MFTMIENSHCAETNSGKHHFQNDVLACVCVCMCESFVFEYFVKDKVMKIRWGNVIEDFDMPLRVYINGKEQWLSPTTAWTTVDLVDANPTVKVDANFYISIQSVLGN